MIKGIHHAGLVVEDLQRTADFYRDAAGLDEVARFRAGERADIVLLKGLNAYLALLHFDGAESTNGEARSVADAGITHICTQLADIDALEARYRKAGANFREKPVALGTGTIYAYVHDPESNTIELEGTPYAPPGNQPWLAHVAFASHDVTRLSSFYSDFVSHPVSREGEYSNNPLVDKVTGFQDTHVKAAWIDGHNQILEFWQYLNPETIARETKPPVSKPGWAYTCFEVDNIGAEYERTASIGARFDTEPADFHGANLCFGRDPDDNLFALLELPDAMKNFSLDSVNQRDVVLRTSANSPRRSEAQK